MRTPISKRRRTGGGNERAYISAILKNRARKSLSLAFIRGFVPSTGMISLKNNFGKHFQVPIMGKIAARCVLQLRNFVMFQIRLHHVNHEMKSFMF